MNLASYRVRRTTTGSAWPELAEQGVEEWSGGLPEEDAEALVDSSAGKPVRWVPGEGWVEGSE